MTFHRRLVAIIPLIISACGIAERSAAVSAGPSGEWPLPPQQPLGGVQVPLPAHERVHYLDLMTDGSVSVTTHRVNADPFEQGIRLLGGQLALRTAPDASLRMIALDILLDDVAVPTGTPGEDLHLTDIHLSLPAPVDVPRDSSGQLVGQFPVDLLLNWKLVTQEGRAWPLTTQRLRGIHLYVHIASDDDGLLRADLLGHVEGTFWDWSGIYSLSDAVLSLRAEEHAEIPPQR